MGALCRRVAIAAIALAILPGLVRAETGASTVTAQDNAVVVAVLRDLAAYKGKDSPIGGFGPSIPLPVDRTPTRGKVSLSSSGDACGLKEERWRSLTTAQRRATEEAARHLERRASGAAGRFVVMLHDIELREEGQRPPRDDALFNIRVTLPGYSDSRRTAIVLLSIPWSIHSASATYVMRVVDNEWQVLVREFAIYP